MEKTKSRIESLERACLRGAVENDFVYSFLEKAYDVASEREEIMPDAFISDLKSRIEKRTMPHYQYSHIAAFARCYRESFDKEDAMNIFLKNIPDALWSDEWSFYDWGRGTCANHKLISE